MYLISYPSILPYPNSYPAHRPKSNLGLPVDLLPKRLIKKNQHIHILTHQNKYTTQKSLLSLRFFSHKTLVINW